jgi:hypothetical protein
LSVAAPAVPELLSIEPVPGEDTQSGCPAGSFDYAVSQDNQLLYMRFYNYEVEAGIQTPGGGQSAEKRCELLGNFRLPAGYAVGIEQITVRAHAEATGPQSRGFIENSYMPQAARRPVNAISHIYAGPYSSDFSLPGRIARDRILFTPCSPFNSEQQIYLNSRMATETIGFDTSALTNHRDHRAVVHEYRFVWARCNDPQPGPGWIGNCRVVLETLWGQDLQDYIGSAAGATQQEAVQAAEQAGHYACERSRSGNNTQRCVTDTNRCFATRQ